VIWLIFGLIYVLLEVGLLGDLTIYPTTGNVYNFKVSLISITIGAFLTGMIQGLVEILWFKERFTQSPFFIKMLYKSIFYLGFIIVFLVILTLVTNAHRLNAAVFDRVVLDSLFRFIKSFTFWSIIIYSGIILDIALFYSEIEGYMGKGIVYNYSFGKYHKPIQETRIFMFLDMKSSTTIAEKIGHEKYFELLKAYYADMSDAILETSGEIYQYVGDEIVVSWTEKKGIDKNNCIECFNKISKKLLKKEGAYREKFGLVPEFKAGFHIGKVTTGVIGIIKKDIVYTGDILNTTARIQSECNTYRAKVLISENLLTKLKTDSSYIDTKIGSLTFRGKKKIVELHRIDFLSV
jgi:adenylate cyclase